ncbi:porphobilinogen synthase [Candidatus Saganbacteria bacterium]|nr:porphobilinogen synthase [Candidatus Saganbacteria bacterium]
MPYFVVLGKNEKQAIKSMPGINRYSVENLLKEIAEIKKYGVTKVLLFGVPKSKSEDACDAYNKNGIVQNAIRAIKKEFKSITVITDVCLCAYTTHGHCRIMESKRKIDNKATLEALAKIAVSHAVAGADVVSPSAMMKGQVKAIRQALDKNGYKKVEIMAYSAKFASNFYGPFREAANSAPAYGDRTGYQLNTADTKGAMQSIRKEIKEGAAIVMIKPALSYLDIIFQAKKEVRIPLAAYNVSGEYSMLKNGGGEDLSLVMEVLTSIKRAGADLIITYFGKEVGKYLTHHG